MINYYFDDLNEIKPYTFQAEANDNTLPPDNALRIEPEFKDGFWPCVKGKKWVLIEDNREKIAYNTETKEPITIDYLGEVKEGFTLLEPFEFCKWNSKDKKWVLDEAAKKKASVPQTLSRAQAETVMDLTPATTLDESNKDKTLLDEINEYMDTLDITVPMYKYIKNVWKNSIEFNRDDDVITTIAAIFKITSDQLDEMFITGAQFSTTLES